MHFFRHCFVLSLLILCGLFCAFHAHAQCATTVNTFPYVADFETGTQGWTTGGTNNDWTWGAPTKAAINHAGSGNNCWITGGLTTAFYKYSENSWVESPCFDFTTLQHPFIRMLIYEETEHKYDGANFQYSTNGGVSWTIVGGYKDTSCIEGYWYNYPAIKYLDAPVALDSTGWSGNSLANSTESGTACQGGSGYSGWVHARHCLQNLAGLPSVKFRFAFGAGNTCNHFDGFAFDSVAIGEAVANTGSITYNCTSSKTVTFTGTAGLPCSDTYAWNFDDPNSGASNTGTTATTTHTFSAPGTYTVTLTISGGPCNAPATITQTIHILGITTVSQNVACFGGNNGAINLTTTGGSGPFTYSWTGGAATQNLNNLAAGTYHVTVTASQSCSITASAVVTQPQVLTVNATPGGGGCSSGNTGTVTITVAGGTGADTYNWSNGASTQNLSTLPSGTYKVTVTDSKGCTATASATVTGNPNPQVTVNSASVCSGGTAILTANGTPVGGTYGWNTGANTASISVSPNVNTSYTVTYTTAACGSVTALATVSVANSANVSVNSDTICTGGIAVLYATPSVAGGTFIWTPGGSPLDSIVVSPNTNTTYSVTYTPVGCPAATGSGSVTVEPTPIVSLTSTDPGCTAGGVIIAISNGGTNPYQYSLNGGSYQQADSFTNLVTNTYSVTTKDTFGCVSAPAPAVINPYIPLALTSTIDSISCLSPTAQINANTTGGTSPYQYSLNSGTYQASTNFSGLAPGSYTLAVQDAVGCTATQTVVIPPSTTLIPLAVQDSARCFGATDGTIIVSTTGGTQPYQYALNTGTFQNNDTFNFVAAGSYTVSVRDANGCLANSSVVVLQPTPLVITTVSSTPVLCPGAHNGTITVVASGGTPVYNYSVTQGSSIFVSTTNGFVQSLDTGTYFIELNDYYGCSVDSSIYVSGPTADSFAVAADSTSCFGSNSNDGAVIIKPLLFQNAPFTYSLNNGGYQSSDSFPGLAPGNYQVVAMDVNGCPDTLPPVTVGEPAASTAVAYPTETTIRAGQQVQLQSNLAGGSISVINSFQWSPSEGLSCADCQNPMASPYQDESSFTVTITYNGHCISSASVTIFTSPGQVFIPNAFTPNGDGDNDNFYIYGYGVKEVNLKVYNRWGEKVFETRDQFLGWDGTYKGVMQMPGVFVYEANVIYLDNSTKNFRGSVTLIR